MREQINISFHSRSNVLELGLAEVPDGPPVARIDQREHLLAGMRISTFRQDEVRHSRIKRRVNSAVVQVVLGRLNGGPPRSSLCRERIERRHGMFCLLHLGLALRVHGFGAVILACAESRRAWLSFSCDSAWLSAC